MADAKGPPKPKEEPSGGGNESMLLLGLAFLVIFWLAGGAKHAANWSNTVPSPLATSTHYQWLPFLNTDSSFQTPTIPLPAGQGIVQQSSSAQNNQPSDSIGNNTVVINDYSGAHTSDPQQEYIVLYAYSNNSSPVTISGWQLHSTHNVRTATIGGGEEVAMLSQPANNAPITLRPGDSAIISTGRSPVGMSLRENKCIGYAGQFQTFVPRLAQSCPDPRSEAASDPKLATDDSCLQAAGNIPTCQAITNPPSGASGACTAFLEARLTYNGCVVAHRNDANFAQSQWRVYLGQTSELWDNNSDTITVTDASGKQITSVKY